MKLLIESRTVSLEASLLSRLACSESKELKDEMLEPRESLLLAFKLF